MEFEEFQRLGQNVKTVITKFSENPGKFAAIVLQMYWDMKSERDNCLKDIDKLREENRNLRELNKFLEIKLGGAEVYNDAIKTYKPMYESLRKQYNTLTNHIRTKAECNPGVSRYIDLVNYIDRLEQK